MLNACWAALEFKTIFALNAKCEKFAKQHHLLQKTNNAKRVRHDYTSRRHT